MSYYLDASFLVAVIVEENRSNEAGIWLKQARETVIISHFAAAEVSAAISRGVRTTRFTEAQARDVLADFDLLRSVCETYVPNQVTYEFADMIVRDFRTNLAAPDALHLASAIEIRATLVTFDERLTMAAEANAINVAKL